MSYSTYNPNHDTDPHVNIMTEMSFSHCKNCSLRIWSIISYCYYLKVHSCFYFVYVILLSLSSSVRSASMLPSSLILLDLLVELTSSFVSLSNVLLTSFKNSQFSCPQLLAFYFLSWKQTQLSLCLCCLFHIHNKKNNKCF